MEYEEREYQKERARDLNDRAENVDQRANALWMTVEAYFNRNPKAVTVRYYAAHFILANQDRLRQEYGQDAIEFLWEREELINPESPLMIKPGYSDWGSAGNSIYRDV